RLRRIAYASLRAPFIPRFKSLGFSGRFYKMPDKVVHQKLEYVLGKERDPNDSSLFHYIIFRGGKSVFVI
ncbi:MAG: hypothetical protein MUO85_01740, partial [candidate division Zixibacteria bacterium]|nr:hypothetical protein [candidate division Zixibacteria bacterium]